MTSGRYPYTTQHRTKEIEMKPEVVSSTNVMRHEYRALTPAENDFMRAIKDKGLEFYAMCEGVQSREMALAKTKIEEAVMWAVKHITR
jgi:hypothetical protein